MENSFFWDFFSVNSKNFDILRLAYICHPKLYRKERQLLHLQMANIIEDSSLEAAGF